MPERSYSEDPTERRDAAFLVLIDERMTPAEISELRVGDVRLFEASATVRVGGRFVRIREERHWRALRSYFDRDVPVRRTAPLFPGRSPIRGMSVSRLYQLLRQLRDEAPAGGR